MTDTAPKAQKKGKFSYLAGNIALFSVSNFVSKILVFLLVPLYTNVLSTREYGVADILQVTILLLVPALTQNIGEAALRFGIEREDKREKIYEIGLKYLAIADVIIAVVASAAALIAGKGQIRLYIVYFAFLFVANALYEFLILYFQGSEKVPVVVIGSVLSTIIMIGCNLVFLLVMKIGLSGYIFSQVFAFLIASITMMLLGKTCVSSDPKNQTESEREDTAKLEKEMISYSRPMLLYSTAAWVNNASDRYLVAWLCGAAVNGVYGVAYKIPAILSVFQRVFAQAWQMSATKTYQDDNSSEFYSKMYRTYNSFMVMGCALLIVSVRPIAYFLFRKEFYEAWVYVPFLLISIIFGALTGFLGSICLAYKDSKSMGTATGIGALLNVIMNLALIPFMGAFGAAVATALSYFVMYALAFKFTSKHVTISRKVFADYAVYVLLVAEALLMILSRGELTKYMIIACVVIVAVIIAINAKQIKEIYETITEIIGRRAGKKQ